MFNKIYVNFKKFIKEKYKSLIVFLTLLFLLTYRLPYYIYVGGGTINLDDRIELKSNETGSYNLSYVKQIYATIPTYLLSYLNPKWDLVSVSKVAISDNEDVSDINTRERLYLEEANDFAILNAYKLAGKKIVMNSNHYKVIYKNEESDTSILVGDELISVNGISINNNSDYKKYLNSLDVNTKLEVKVLRDNKEITCYATLKEINNEKIIGLYLVNIYDYEVEPDIKLKFKWNESGSSGGFMLSLAIYDRLVEEDLTKGRKIVGTGTIDANGLVGEIGGVKYKVMGASKSKADIFFCPKENYEEAINTKNKYNLKIKIVKVETLQEAIDYLRNN